MPFTPIQLDNLVPEAWFKKHICLICLFKCSILLSSLHGMYLNFLAIILQNNSHFEFLSKWDLSNMFGYSFA